MFIWNSNLAGHPIFVFAKSGHPSPWASPCPPRSHRRTQIAVWHIEQDQEIGPWVSLGFRLTQEQCSRCSCMFPGEGANHGQHPSHEELQGDPGVELRSEKARPALEWLVAKPQGICSMAELRWGWASKRRTPNPANTKRSTAESHQLAPHGSL